MKKIKNPLSSGAAQMRPREPRRRVGLHILQRIAHFPPGPSGTPRQDQPRPPAPGRLLLHTIFYLFLSTSYLLTCGFLLTRTPLPFGVGGLERPAATCADPPREKGRTKKERSPRGNPKCFRTKVHRWPRETKDRRPETTRSDTKDRSHRGRASFRGRIIALGAQTGSRTFHFRPGLDPKTVPEDPPESSRRPPGSPRDPRSTPRNADIEQSRCLRSFSSLRRLCGRSARRRYA